MVCLLERQELLAEIRENSDLVMPALREGERFEGPLVVQPRLCTKDVSLRDVDIPAGSAILMCLASGNRDDEAYADPDSFQIHRDGPHPLTFGLGAHLCPGMNTSRLENKALLDALLATLPNLRLDPSVPPPSVHGFHFRAPQVLHVVWD
jgi:cytochrome P450